MTYRSLSSSSPERRPVRFLPLLVTLTALAAPALVSAETIQIGTFTWENVTEDQDEFLFFCDSAEPCSRFTLTNDLDDLTPQELSNIGLANSDVPFDNVQFQGVLGGSLGSLSAALGSFVWISTDQIDTATVWFQLLGGLTGNLLFPTLMGPSGTPAGIFVEFTPEEPPPATVPEPSTILLLSTGLLSALAHRRTRVSV